MDIRTYRERDREELATLKRLELQANRAATVRPQGSPPPPYIRLFLFRNI